MARTRVETTKMFVLYCVRLAVRALLLAAAVVTFVLDRSALDPSRTLGPAHGLDVIDIAFVLMVADLATKFFKRAAISMGSLKQYRRYHIPTKVTAGETAREKVRALVSGRAAELIREKVDAARSFLPRPSETSAKVKSELSTAAGEIREVREVSAAYVRRLLNEPRFLDFIRFNDELLEADAPERARLHVKRLGEIAPVIIFWIVFNALVAIVLWLMGWLMHETAMLWALFYFFFDVFSVVVWCPIQVVLMRNRCCATCQIFNWDGIMAATPLIFVRGWFGWTILVLSAIVLLRWELSAAFHPERFDESTNARLSCAQCTEKLCRIRGKIEA